MLDRVARLPGSELRLDAYLADFEARLWRVDSTWKLERHQHFREPDVPSWVAMAEGDWTRALTLADEMRPGITALQRQLDTEGIVQRRVRIVELPASDYLRWELYVHRIRADLGERIRVLPSSAVTTWETSAPLPEIIVLGQHTAYQIRYDDGIAIGAKRLDDPEIAVACRKEIAALWQRTEDLSGFLARTAILPGSAEPR